MLFDRDLLSEKDYRTYSRARISLEFRKDALYERESHVNRLRLAFEALRRWSQPSSA